MCRNSTVRTIETGMRMNDLLDSALVWDAHAGVFPDPGVNLDLLQTWRDYSCNYVSINVGFDVVSWEHTVKTLAAYRKWILAHGDRVTLAGTVEDIFSAQKQGKIAVAFDIEGMNALNGDINMVGVYHGLGVRQMLFAYNLGNAAAGGCHDEDTGLTDFGRAIVQEMNRVGVIVDCSHASSAATMHIMAESSKPVVFSHSNPAAIWDHQRNISDEQIRRCARTGGVVGINGMGIFLGDNDVNVDTILKHVCHVCDLVGPDHVGFGFDFSPTLDIDIGSILRSRPDYWPQGQQYDTPGIKHAGPPVLPGVVEALAKRGFEDGEILGILGGNFLRVAMDVWGGS